MRILIVEDERRLGRTIGDLLEVHNYTADLCYDGESGLDCALSGIYDAVILDVMLPKRDGFSVARELRRAGVSVPVLMLTARSEVEDKVAGLDSGADYYLTKPFANEELLACLRALTRKQGGGGLDNALTFGDLRLELDSARLLRGERSVQLSRKEFEILRLLMAARGQVVGKESIILKVWGYESEAETNNVEVYISFLRKKLAHLKSGVTVRNLRMLGYRLETEEPV